MSKQFFTQQSIVKKWNALTIASLFVIIFTTIFSSSSTVYAAPDSGLTSMWGFDKINGSIVEDGKGNNPAPIIGGMSLGTGKVGKAGYFNGSNYLKIPNSSSLNFGRSDFSIVTWIKTSEASSTVLDKRSPIGYHVMIQAGRVLFQIYDNNSHYKNYYSNASNLADGKWHMIAISIDRSSSSGLKFYVDGKLDSSHNPTSYKNSITNTSPLYIGRHKDGNRNFIGYMDEFQINARALSADDILGLYRTSSNGRTAFRLKHGSKILGYWNFSNGDASDLSGNGNHGILKNGAHISSGNLILDGIDDYVLIPELNKNIQQATYTNSLAPNNSGFTTLTMESELKLKNKSSYYNFIFSNPNYTLGAHSLSSNNPRITWIMQGVRSKLGDEGGRWGSGPNLSSTPDIASPAYYWGYELSKPLDIENDKSVRMKVIYDYTANEVTIYLKEKNIFGLWKKSYVLVNRIPLRQFGP